MQRRRLLPAAAVMLVLAGGAGAAPPKAVPPKAAAPANDSKETEAFLRQMGDAQKWMGEELWRVKEKVEALPGLIAQCEEDNAAAQEQIDKLRDEVKGLYVELSGVKERFDELKQDIAGVNDNVTSFRNSSGVFLALVLVMAFISTVMTVLRR
jgi:septal ring factor EnvC (AmiA/AmiB activator)